MEVVLSGERSAGLRAEPLAGAGQLEELGGEVGPETCSLNLGVSGSKTWLQLESPRQFYKPLLQNGSVYCGARTLEFACH